MSKLFNCSTTQLFFMRLWKNQGYLQNDVLIGQPGTFSPKGAYLITYVTLEKEKAFMKTIAVTKARNTLYKLIDQARDSGEAITITGKRGNAVLISEEDWRSIQETLYLVSIPGMRESIRKGLDTPADECSEDLDW